ncbi:nucleotidyltransferase domain-containing protein [Sulfolobus metallicus DSM 6482 = JCM 9184]|uniref:Nucleotidyltransferase domain-containing protein n=1 Tax=Sulfuracidifex metallicus DSM 6482 = JCM 9184 TaxID=523847 RepID=A0A6A9QMW5_SULME|nr:nucleotidyltransferase domain-containing protein [Sulfuracidifex metallicus DSM 6482 = JCM 9184]
MLMKEPQNNRESRLSIRQREFMDYVYELCSKYTVILFGSRGRGDFTEESDYDILVIGEGNVPMHQEEWIDVYFVELSSLDKKIEEFHPFVIDSFYEGFPLCDTLKIYDKIKVKVLERVKGFRKDKIGWIKESKK